jgi:PPM family protein phosphatase
MIRTERAHLYVAAQSDPGLSGKNNEDNFAVSAYALSQYNPTPCVFAIVSDGIGGHRSGEVASEMTVNMISQIVANSDGGNPQAVFQQAFYAVSEKIVEQADLDATHKGMGATAACVWIIGPQLYIAYAGDSRIYLMRGNHILQLTRDHTWVQEAVDKGILDRAQVRTHPNLHVIRRYFGSDEPPEPDFRLYLQPGESDARARSHQGTQLVPGDVVMLCSDGLTDLVGENEMANMLPGRTLNQAAKSLIDLANQRGGHDNITIVMLGVPGWAQQKNPGWLPGS